MQIQTPKHGTLESSRLASKSSKEKFRIDFPAKPVEWEGRTQKERTGELLW